MKMIDPTYLRTIVDGLSSGALQKDNPAALPQGLVGVYEEAMPPECNVNDRQQFLAFFGMWAMLKKEASAELVADLLDSFNEAQVLDYISRYSKWFNAPSSGRYVLYHDRLRTFVLQKLSEGDVLRINQRIINLSYKALENKQGDEWEHYALEHLSAHILLNAMLSKETGTELKKLAYDVQLWNRQIKLSKGFEWSKKMLNDMMLWALKYDGDEVIECALSKVDLHYLEQNDAANIVALVAQNDMEAALKRIETFGGNDIEGLQRKFTLYMLCLMELTLLEGRKSPHRAKGIKQLLVHLDEQLPIDHSVLDWNDFFPSYLMFQMACEWAALGLNFMIPYLRADHWELDWISDKGPYSSLQLQVLMECARGISDDWEKSAAFYIIYSEIDKMGKGAKSLTVLYELLTCVRGINDDYKKSRGLKKIAEELIKQSQEVEAEYVIREALNIVRDISKQSEKSIALMGIAVNLYKLQQREAGSSILKEARDVASFITEISDKANTLLNISEEMHKLGLLEEAAEVIKETIDITHELSYHHYIETQYVYADIAIELCKQGKVDEALKLARGLKRAENKCFALCEIATQMYKKDSRGAFVLIMDEALLVATEIWNSTGDLSCLEKVAENFCRQNCTPKAVALTEGLGSLILTSQGASFLSTVALELAKQGELAEATKLALEIVDYSRGAFRKSVALMEIVGHLAQNEDFVTSMQLASKITDKDEYRTALKKIANSLAKSGDLNAVSEFIQLSLSNSPGLNLEEKIGAAREIVFDLTKRSQLKNGLSLLKVIDDEVATELVHLLHENGLFWESRLIAKEIREVGNRRYCLGIIVDKLSVKQLESIFHELDDEVIIVKLLAKQGEFQQALDIARVMNNVADQDSAFASIALEFRNQEQLNDSLEICKSMVDSWSRTTTMLRIAEELAKKGALKDASDWLKETLSAAWEIKNQGDKIDALIVIAEEMCRQGLVEGALKIIKKLNTVSDGSLPLCTIPIELSKQGQLEESLAIARDISNERQKCNTLRKVAIELSKQGKVEESASVMQESLAIARGISDVWQKNRELMEISIELLKQGQVEESLTIARGISDELQKSSALWEVAIELSKQGQVEEPLGITREISDARMKSSALEEISKELSKQGLVEKSLAIAQEMSDESKRDRAMKGISLELSKLSHWDMAVEVGRKISNAAGQQKCWEAIGEAMFNLHGGQNALEKLTLLPSEEIRRFYLKGWVGALAVAEASSYCSPLAVGHLKDDMGSLVELLQKYALGQVAFGNPSPEWVERLNYSLNIQWLMDLKNQTHE
jgi:hypothetical protein